MTKEKDILCNIIKNARLKCNLTQQELAEKANLTPKYISEVERGTRKFSFQALETIIPILHIDARDIFPYIEENKKDDFLELYEYYCEIGKKLDVEKIRSVMEIVKLLNK